LGLRPKTTTLDSPVRLIVGSELGSELGDAVGDVEGDAVGDVVGDAVGDPEGDAVGDPAGNSVGFLVGESVGKKVGDAVGESDGAGLAVGNVPPDVGAAVGSGSIPLSDPLEAADGASVDWAFTTPNRVLLQDKAAIARTA